jgi:hypothetical protein
MKKAGLFGLALLLCALPVAAEGFFISPLLAPLAEVSIGDLYMQYALIVDFFLAFIIFGGIAQFALKNIYKEHSKGVALAAALILAFAFSFFESRYGWTLGQLDWLAMIILMSFFVFFVYQTMRGFGAKPKLAMAVLYIIIYACVSAFLPWVMEFINVQARQSFGVAVIQLLIHVILITAVVKIIIGVINSRNEFDKGYR